MLSKETNLLLTRIGPGTPMGQYLRRYWHPIAAEHELSAPGIKAVRLMGEDLVLYRDLSGALGLIGRRCPHRGADLSYGFVEKQGVRCSYHGWLFNSGGHCVERPFEDAAGIAPSGPRPLTCSYGVRAYAGLLWAYLGRDPAPLIPDWEPFSWKNGFVQIFFATVPCNWLQCQENVIDPVHFEWMHMNWSTRKSGRTEPYAPRHLRVDFEETDFGFIYRRITEATTAADEMWTIGRVALWPNGFYAGEHFDWHVPIDDESTLRVTWAFARVPTEKEPFQQKSPFPSWHGPVKGADGRWLSERPANQDFVSWVGQGVVADRTRENLSASDRGVILLRKRFLRELESTAAGAEPKAVVRHVHANVQIPLPCIHRELFIKGLPRDEMLAHPTMGWLLRSYPFQEGEPPEVRAAFNAALGLDDEGQKGQ